MSLEAALVWADTLIFQQTGAHLSELQVTILQQVWHGQRYLDIATNYGCTEGHVKDTGAHLWKLLSAASGEKVSKRTYPTIAQKYSHTPAPCDPTRANPVLAPPLYFGRSQEASDLDRLSQAGARIILIQGEGGIGKTTFAQHYLQTASFEIILELLIAKEPGYLVPVESVVEEWLQRDFHEEPGRDLSINLARLKRHLQSSRIGILIDNLETALDPAGCLISQHRSYLELLRILADPQNQSLTVITSRDRLCDQNILVAHYRLSGLSCQSWQRYWDQIAINSQPQVLAAVHHTYGGNAKAMHIIGGIIREDFGHDAAQFLRDACHNPLQSIALKNLVSGQLDRLAQLDRAAYRLLCRLGCYRFQDQPKVPREALLALLWDIPPTEHQQVIESLRNRSLVECHGGEYWLHPVIRAAAIARLKSGNDWERATRKAAQFWQGRIAVITSLDAALTIWEAFYHYVEIQDFNAASQVILQPHLNQWQQYLPLGSLLYRMGLSQLVLNAIRQILPHVTVQSKISELNNILGDLYWISGQIQQAIASQKTALNQAIAALDLLPQSTVSAEDPRYQHQTYYFKMLEIDSLFSLGLYHLYLWDLPQASIQLQQVIDISQQTQHHRWAEKAIICLALVQSYQGQQAYPIQIQAIVAQVMDANHRAYQGSFVFFIQRLGQIYTNLGQIELAQKLYETAIAYAQESQYRPVMALAQTGLAELSRFRQEYDRALVYHQGAVQILETIGATCDLAESYLQWGLTLKQMKKPATQMFEKAIALYQKINAPLQVLRIRRLQSY